MSGWIKLHRSTLDKAFMKDPNKLALWVWLLLKANHKEREEVFGGQIIKCKPGQFTTGRKQISDETGISESTVDRILKLFKNEQQIEQQTSNKNRLITIKNWDIYQQSKNDEQQNEQQVNNNWTTTEQQVNTLQERKKIRKKEAKQPAAASEQDFTNIKSQVENFRDGTTNRWHKLTSLWKTTEDSNILHNQTRKKYWDKLEEYVQKDIIEVVESLGSDVQYLENVWISQCFKNKTINKKFFQEQIEYYKNRSVKNKIPYEDQKKVASQEEIIKSASDAKDISNYIN